MQPIKTVSVFSFFSGIGLLDLGFEDEGYEICFVNEFHKPFLDAYHHSRSKLGKSAPKYGTHGGSIEDLLEPSYLEKFKGFVDEEKSNGKKVLFIGGPPCPDFSVGGKNRGSEGENGRLTSTYFELIQKVKPDLFIFENVRGLFRTQKHRSFFDSEINSLSKSGYHIKFDLFNALQFGVGQDRFRLICLGAMEKTVELSKFNSFNLNNQSKYDHNLILKSNKYSKTVDLFESKIPDELTTQYWFDRNDVANHPNSSHYFVPRAALPKFKTVEEGDASKKSFKRLHRSRYSPTAAYGNNEVHIHPTEPRRISAAEALSIQSAPKHFELPANMTLTNMFKSIGNAVPYLMAKAIASETKKLI